VILQPGTCARAKNPLLWYEILHCLDMDGDFNIRGVRGIFKSQMEIVYLKLIMKWG
jgi:hypothetical protein